MPADDLPDIRHIILQKRLSAIERGERKPTLETFYKIGQAMGIRSSVLLAAIEEEMEKQSG